MVILITITTTTILVSSVCGVCGGKCDTGTRVWAITLFFPSRYLSINSPQPFIHPPPIPHNVSHQKKQSLNSALTLIYDNINVCVLTSNKHSFPAWKIIRTWPRGFTVSAQWIALITSGMTIHSGQWTVPATACRPDELATTHQRNSNTPIIK
jgi:hypothetical protein